MKVLHVITTINLGGAENHLYGLVESQKSIGNNVCIVYLKGDHYWKESYNRIGVESYCLNIPFYHYIYRFWSLRKILASFNPDIVHVHMPPAELVARLALLLNKKWPLIISKHNDEPFAPFVGNYLFGSWVSRRASRIICISKCVQNYMKKWMSIRDFKKTNVVYYSVNKNKFSNSSPASDIFLPHCFTIGTIARLVPQKSLDTLLKAFAILKSKYPLLRLVIVGIGPLESELKNLASHLNIANDIVWTGVRSDVPCVLKTFDVFALTSIYEGFGLVLLEAMAAGVPIIASNVSAIPEVLMQGHCGLLVEPKNVNELVKGLEKMMDIKVREHYKENGFQRLQNSFSAPQLVEAVQSIYTETIIGKN